MRSLHYSAAAAAVLAGLFGAEIPEVSMTSPTAPGVTRKWTRLQDYADEVAMARIYAGVHYRFSNKVGQDMGRKIGELTLGTQIAPRLRQKGATDGDVAHVSC